MTRKRRTSNEILVGQSTKPNKKKKSITSNLLLDIEPLTANQQKFFNSYKEGKNIFSYGSSGSGKTFISLYSALKEVLDERTPYEKVIILRSTIQSFEIGFTPGNINEKIAPFESPYKYMVKYMFQLPTDDDFEFLYGNLKAEKLLDFMCVSFLRGTTFDNCILIIDEFQNLNYHLLSSVITRVGSDCKILFSGDSKQTDLIKTNDRQGLHDFMRVLNIMPSIDMIEFTIDDVVRSGLVKEFLIAEHTIGI